MLTGLRNDTTQDKLASTRWTVVIAAGETGFSSGHGLDALSELCRIYWRPLYLFLRREGIGAEDAQQSPRILGNASPTHVGRRSKAGPCARKYHHVREE